MSDLLKNNGGKKKLLNRGPKIVPAQEFKLEEKDTAAVTSPKEQKTADSKVAKKREAAQITSVRVTKATRNKLNALIQLGKAENVDILIDILLDEYIENTLLKEEKKTFNLVLDIIQKRDR